jgi:hypothetical protein
MVVKLDVSPAVAAIRFGTGMVAAWLIIVAMLSGGTRALLTPPLAFAAAGIWASSTFGLGLLARLGFGSVLALGGTGSFFALVGTQGMTGREGAVELTYFTCFVAAYECRGSAGPDSGRNSCWRNRCGLGVEIDRGFAS